MNDESVGASTLYLHIGHGKTGSSYLQACFAASQEYLAEHGINYVWNQSVDRALCGETTSGNGYDLAQAFLKGQAREYFGENVREGHVLYSSEHLFRAMAGRMATVTAAARECGFNDGKLLLFIRDPIEHVVSGYGQEVKRGGIVCSLEEHAKVFDVPSRVACFLKEVVQYEFFELTIVNYSRVRKSVCAAVERWLRLAEGGLRTPDRGQVNRSLTAMELEFVRNLNGNDRAIGRLVADYLVERYPEVNHSKVIPPITCQESMFSRLRMDIECVNSYVPVEHQYDTRVVPPLGVAGELVGSCEEIERICAAFVHASKRLHSEETVLREKKRRSLLWRALRGK